MFSSIIIRGKECIRLLLSPADLEKVIHAVISYRRDYCSTFYSGISRQNIERLKLLQNAAAMLLTHSKRSDHIRPIPATLDKIFEILLLHCLEI